MECKREYHEVGEVFETDTLKRQLTVLKEIMQDYPGKTIDNIVLQMEARVKEMEKGGSNGL